MYETLHDRGLEILAFPSNQFGNQEPGTDEEIQNFCKSYGVSFPVFSKVLYEKWNFNLNFYTVTYLILSYSLYQIDVNGPDAHPLYKYLKKKTGGTELAWNFFKILVVDGVPVRRYKANVSPKDITQDLLPYLEPTNTDEL